MLALLVAALVPTVVMTAALLNASNDACSAMCLSIGRTSTAAVKRSMGDGNAAALVGSRLGTPVDLR